MELERHLPQELDFYGMGAIVSRRTPRVQAAALAETATCVVSFALSGDERGLVLVAFDREPKEDSMVMEMANILAAKAVSHYCDAQGALVTLSPPRYIDRDERGFRGQCEALASLAMAPQGPVACYEFNTVDGAPIRILLGHFVAPRGIA